MVGVAVGMIAGGGGALAAAGGSSTEIHGSAQSTPARSGSPGSAHAASTRSRGTRSGGAVWLGQRDAAVSTGATEPTESTGHGAGICVHGRLGVDAQVRQLPDEGGSPRLPNQSIAFYRLTAPGIDSTKTAAVTGSVYRWRTRSADRRHAVDFGFRRQPLRGGRVRGPDPQHHDQRHDAERDERLQHRLHDHRALTRPRG